MADCPKIVLTGPTGWIGAGILAHLANRFGGGWQDSVRLFGTSARTVSAPDGSSLVMRPLDEIDGEATRDAIVIHLAYLTKEKVELVGERRFMDTNLAIDDAVLAAISAGQPRFVFVASSGAAALAAAGSNRHPYGLSKLRQEDRFLELAASKNFPVLIGRIYNLSGPYINKLESYAISNFLGQARKTGEITIEARVPVFRSFLHIDNLSQLIVEAGIRALGFLKPIDMCGAQTMEMSDIASAVVALVPGTTIARSPIDWTRPSAYLGNFTETKILSMQLDVALVAFSEQVADTARWMEKIER